MRMEGHGSEVSISARGSAQLLCRMNSTEPHKIPNEVSLCWGLGSVTFSSCFQLKLGIINISFKQMASC